MKHILALILILFTGCTMVEPLSPVITAIPGDTEEGTMFTLTSSAFQENGNIADRYTYSMGNQCSGENYSPALEWTSAPEGTQSYVLTVIDPDGGDWVHWLLVNIPSDVSSLEEAVNGSDVGVEGRNSFRENGYGGPCPPSGTHRYVFTLYALDKMLDVAPGVTWRDVSPLLKGHIIGQCQLTGLRSAK
jgi:Raf kinase inhibitor-like YbhB/YbcL family protein